MEKAGELIGPEKTDMDVVEEKTYRNRTGQTVKEFIPVFEKGKPVYRGLANVVVNGRGMGGQPVQQNVVFEFSFPEGTTLKQAFHKFDSTFRAAWALAEAEHKERQRIVAARSVPRILGPAGTPAH